MPSPLTIQSRLLPDLLQELLNLKWAVPARLGFGWRHCATGLHKFLTRYPAQARAQTQYKWRMEGVAHTLMLDEHKAKVNRPPTPRFPAIGDALRRRSGGEYRAASPRECVVLPFGARDTGAGILIPPFPRFQFQSSAESHKSASARTSSYMSRFVLSISNSLSAQGKCFPSFLFS
jgi:hypothetical protein